jgi:hypothetical protein
MTVTTLDPHTYGESGGALLRLPSHWGWRHLKEIASVRLSNVDKLSQEHESGARLCNYVDVYKQDTSP